MLIRLRHCEDVGCNYITLVILIYKDKTRARRRRTPSSYFVSNLRSFFFYILICGIIKIVYGYTNRRLGNHGFVFI